MILGSVGSLLFVLMGWSVCGLVGVFDVERWRFDGVGERR